MGVPGRCISSSGIDVSFGGVRNLLIKAADPTGGLLRFADVIVILANGVNGEVDSVFILSLIGRSLRNGV